MKIDTGSVASAEAEQAARAVTADAIAVRLRQARALDGRPWTTIAKEARVPYRTIQDALHQLGDGGRGRRKRGAAVELLARVARVLQVRAGWLAFGEGDHGRV